MDKKQFTLVIAQRFSDDLEELHEAIRTELATAPEIVERLSVVETRSANHAMICVASECNKEVKPLILVITGAVFDDNAFGGRRIGRHLSQTSIPVWMYSRMCAWEEGIERCYQKGGDKESGPRRAQILAKAVVKFFKEHLSSLTENVPVVNPTDG